MTILDLQRRIMEAGRIRIGEKRTSNGKTFPAKLETFRLTSPDKQRIDQAAQLYGGTPSEWQAPAGKQWQVTTTSTALDVIVPPSDMAFSQAYEIWSAGGCQRRCDGTFEQMSDGPCLCDPDDRECDIHTRLSVLLRDLPGLGVWRIDTQGYYAAVELAGAVQVIGAAAGRGVLLPARLLLVQRSVIRRDKDGKPQTRRFAVPVLDVEITPGQLLGGLAETMALTDQRLVSLEPPKEDRPALLAPVPETMIERPVGSVAEQAAAVNEPQPRRKRSNAAQPIPETGIEPRTAAEAQLEIPPAPAEADEDDVAWADLYGLLAESPSESETMKTQEGRLRSLFDLMTKVGLWKPAADGTDALHLALSKWAKADHVGELKKDKLVAFARLSWEKAQDAVKKLEEAS